MIIRLDKTLWDTLRPIDVEDYHTGLGTSENVFTQYWCPMEDIKLYPILTVRIVDDKEQLTRSFCVMKHDVNIAVIKVGDDGWVNLIIEKDRMFLQDEERTTLMWGKNVVPFIK